MSIAVLAALLGIAAYRYFWRPLPTVSGSVSAPVGAAATIVRDALGVPHIEAASVEDAIFLQGYVTAQDRLWQMDTLRRSGAGELAEVFGAKAVDADRLSRQMRMRAIAEAYVRAAKPDERMLFVEFSRGVNFFLRSNRGNYPVEFSLPGHSYSPREWTPVDCALVQLVMFRDLTTSWKDDLARSILYAAAPDPAKAQRLFPALEGGYVQPGSNSWAVTGAHTADGKPMLASDPHLAYSIPSIWYMLHLKAPGLDVSGVTVPGLPGVVIGHNRDIAWGMTNIGADYQDLYKEDLDPQTGRYTFQGRPMQAQLDVDMIGVYQSKPVEVNTWVTRHGPVLFARNGVSYALRWTAAEGFGYPVLAIDQAHNWQDFRAALTRFWGPPQNFTYADRAGNIGYQASGAMPVRTGFTGEVPLDGASGKFEWAGIVPFGQLPSFYDPAGGIVATANQDPFPPNFPYSVNGHFADRYRVDQIRARLAAKASLTVADMLAIQKDVYSAYHSFLARQVLAALAHHAPATQSVIESAALLRGWNGQMDKDHAAPLITEFLHLQLGQALTAIVSPHAGAALAVAPSVIEALLRERPSGWVSGNDWDAWLLVQLDAALKQGRRFGGSPMSVWQYGSYLRWNFRHPVGSQLPLLDRFFDLGPEPMSGAGVTVKQTKETLGPSMRMVVDFGNLDRSVQNIATGESGEVASPHYKDQWNAYYAGQSFPMQFQHVDAKQVLRVTPQ